MPKKFRFVVEVDSVIAPTESKALEYLAEKLGWGVGNGRESPSYWAARINPYKRPRAGAGAIAALEEGRDRIASLEGVTDDLKIEVRPPFRHGFSQARTMAQGVLTDIIREAENARVEKK